MKHCTPKIPPYLSFVAGGQVRTRRCCPRSCLQSQPPERLPLVYTALPQRHYHHMVSPLMTNFPRTLEKQATPHYAKAQHLQPHIDFPRTLEKQATPHYAKALHLQPHSQVQTPCHCHHVEIPWAGPHLRQEAAILVMKSKVSVFSTIRNGMQQKG